MTDEALDTPLERKGPSQTIDYESLALTIYFF